MNLFKMIGPAVSMIFDLKYLSKYRKAIDYNRKVGNRKEEQQQILNATISWGTRLVEHFDVDLTVEGHDNIPEGPVLFMSNHQGYADIVAFCAAIKTKQFGFVAKKVLGEIPLYGKWIGRIRSIFIERDDARGTVKVINDGIELLEEGFSLVIFPEGTRSLSEKMGHFKRGSAKLATKAEVPIVPVTLSGSWKVLEEKGYIQKGTKVRVFVHPAIETIGMPRHEENELSERVENIVRSKLEEWDGSL